MKVNMDLGLDLVKVMVSDDGRGFDAEALFETDPARLDTRSQALVTLKEKFDLVGGMMSINSGDEGTVIRLELPTMG
jgi:signal transduction histidine kinase